MENILLRIVFDKKDLNTLLEILNASETVFPIKEVLARLQDVKCLNITADERLVSNDLTAVYI